jgi:hypothetical protein
LKLASEDPSKHFEFPDFGSESMKSLLLNPLSFASEICMVLDKFSMRCAFDFLMIMECF